MQSLFSYLNTKKKGKSHESRKRLTAFFLAGMLILTSNVTGFAEETTADQQPEEAKSTYLLTVDAEDSTVTVKVIMLSRRLHQLIRLKCEVR